MKSLLALSLIPITAKVVIKVPKKRTLELTSVSQCLF